MSMRRTKSRSTMTVAAMGAAAVAATMLAAGPASAASWLSDPGNCTATGTAVERVVSGRTVQVRYGTCNGVQHGWGRILGYGSGDYIRFEVDTNGDRKPDGVSWYLATNRNYTAAYPTSTSSSRAFRACFVRSSSETCNSTNATAWW